MDIIDLKEFGETTNKILGHELTELMKFRYIFVKENLIDTIQSLQEVKNEVESYAKVKEIVLMVLQEDKAKVTSSQLDKADAGVVMSFFYNIINQLTELTQLEKDHLSSSPDPTMLAAGVSRLNNLGEMVTLMGIANDDYFLAKKYGDLPYEEVFWILLYKLVKGDIEKKANEIISKKK